MRAASRPCHLGGGSLAALGTRTIASRGGNSGSCAPTVGVREPDPCSQPPADDSAFITLGFHQMNTEGGDSAPVSFCPVQTVWGSRHPYKHIQPEASFSL